MTNTQILLYSLREELLKFNPFMIMITLFASLNAFSSAYTQSDSFGKLLMWALLALSVLCWIVLSYKIWQAKKVKTLSLAFHHLIEKNKHRILELQPSDVGNPLPKYIPHPFAKIYFVLKEKTFETLTKKMYFLKQHQGYGEEVHLTTNDIDILEQHAATALSSEYKRLEKHLFILSTVVTLAPFLGLLGTVWGILVTFTELHAGGAAGSNSVILGGISTALVTTVLGLIIAIPALISYNYLKNNLKAYSSDMEDFLSGLLSVLELQYRKVEMD